MELYDYFKEDYELIEATGNGKYEVIDAFLDDFVDGKEQQYSEPLKAVFIHKTKNEMFLVLDCLKLETDCIKSVCEQWEQRVLSFLNFGKEYRENIQFLKYEICLMILCMNVVGNADDELRFETEKSIKICRKIFLICDENGEIIEDDEVIIPFYFEPVKNIDNSIVENLEKDIEALIPNNAEIHTLCKKEEMSSEDFKILYEWLSENDNN